MPSFTLSRVVLLPQNRLLQPNTPPELLSFQKWRDTKSSLLLSTEHVREISRNPSDKWESTIRMPFLPFFFHSLCVLASKLSMWQFPTKSWKKNIQEIRGISTITFPVCCCPTGSAIPWVWFNVACDISRSSRHFAFISRLSKLVLRSGPDSLSLNHFATFNVWIFPCSRSVQMASVWHSVSSDTSYSVSMVYGICLFHSRTPILSFAINFNSFAATNKSLISLCTMLFSPTTSWKF